MKFFSRSKLEQEDNRTEIVLAKLDTAVKRFESKVEQLNNTVKKVEDIENKGRKKA